MNELGVFTTQNQAEQILRSAEEILNDDPRKADSMLTFMLDRIQHDLTLKTVFRRYFWHSRAIQLIRILLTVVRSEKARGGRMRKATEMAEYFEVEAIHLSADASHEMPRLDGVLGQLLETVRSGYYGPEARDDVQEFLEIVRVPMTDWTTGTALCEILITLKGLAGEYLAEENPTVEIPE
jgi:hypothetical protein